MKRICKKRLFLKIRDLRGFWFHIIGIICLFWFLIRVVPSPNRSQYPCQQIAIPVALGYISFWTFLISGLIVWMKKVRNKTLAITPAILIVFILIFSISGFVFANNYLDPTPSPTSWNPTSKEPIGVPKGVNPGRVVWIWNPDATESDLQGFWWMKENNNQLVIDEMFSKGIKGLADIDDEYEAWVALFEYFNKENGYGDISYQPGEKIAIKINLNNQYEYYLNPYTKKDNERDASPYVIKSLLRQLVNIVGVAQEDITIYDASRCMGNWFYNRVYFENYPSIPLTPEFPKVNYVDKEGDAVGRQKVEASSERIFFADTSGLFRTLPKCVVDAKYMINIPLLKRHPINYGVTLSGKNHFGSWIEPVVDIHPYHEAAFTLGNPTPQTDLLGHKHLGGKTLLYVGDGMFPTVEDHREIGKFQMYPFNNDYTNSLFLSQDPIALDSVMYDFLFTEGTNPCEESQYYLHESAEPQLNVYDPENDGIYLSKSLGVHEHWDVSVNIFSSDRYSGPLNSGIDFLTYGQERAEPSVIISKPKENYLYFFGQEKLVITPIMQKILMFPQTIIIGRLDVEAKINNIPEEVEKVEFYIDGRLKSIDFKEPYTWSWIRPAFFRHKLCVVAYTNEGKSFESNLIFWKFF